MKTNCDIAFPLHRDLGQSLHNNPRFWRLLVRPSPCVIVSVVLKKPDVRTIRQVVAESNARRDRRQRKHGQSEIERVLGAEKGINPVDHPLLDRGPGFLVWLGSYDEGISLRKIRQQRRDYTLQVKRVGTLQQD